MSELVSLALCASAALAVMTDGEKGLDSQRFHLPAAYYSSNRLNIQLHVLRGEAQVKSGGERWIISISIDLSSEREELS